MPGSACPKWSRDIVGLLIVQVILLVLYIVFVRYDPDFDMERYTYFQHVHAMIFVGFGFLMTFLGRYGYSSVGFNFLLASTMIQWAVLTLGFFNLSDDNKILMHLPTLWEADIASASVLISMGALLGQTSFIQLIIMGLIEIAFYSGNVYVVDHMLQAKDPGGTMIVHLFGAYFGLAASFVINVGKTEDPEEVLLEAPTYTSDMFAMIGTIFLWIYWPSFNAIELTATSDAHRAVVNTYLALAASCVSSYVFSQLMCHEHKFDMVHIQNSTLAGGVAVGTVVGLPIEPYGAIVIGIVAAFISVGGYVVITPFIRKHYKIRDTCGVHNLHGMPAVFGGIGGVLMAAISNPSWYGTDRSEIAQSLFQFAAVGSSFGFAIVGGIIAGMILRWVVRNTDLKFLDETGWVIPEESED